MSTSSQPGGHGGYRDKWRDTGHQIHEDSAVRMAVIWGIIIAAILLMVLIWRLALLQT